MTKVNFGHDNSGSEWYTFSIERTRLTGGTPLEKKVTFYIGTNKNLLPVGQGRWKRVNISKNGSK